LRSTTSRALHVSQRTLARRSQRALGLSPWAMVQRQRLEMAVELLRTTNLAFEKIAARVGYGDSSALRRLMHRELGTTPGAVRQ
jgi:transcriptional regulator GlxA family with amidase domain